VGSSVGCCGNGRSERDEDIFGSTNIGQGGLHGKSEGEKVAANHSAATRSSIFDPVHRECSWQLFREHFLWISIWTRARDPWCGSHKGMPS